jgi:hypothetical protein
MREAFNAAWERICETSSADTGSSYANQTREQLALLIIALVRKTEPDVDSLCNEALRQCGFVCVDFICTEAAPAIH